MPTDQLDLSFVADALLAIVGQDAEAPFRTEDRWEAYVKRLSRRERESDENASAALGAKYAPLLASEVADVMRDAKLTSTQWEVLEFRLLGLTFEEIGARRRTTKQGAMNVFVQGLGKVSRTFRAYRYAGLSDCYQEDVGRGVRRTWSRVEK